MKNFMQIIMFGKAPEKISVKNIFARGVYRFIKSIYNMKK
jgi:hypothetical protein